MNYQHLKNKKGYSDAYAAFLQYNEEETEFAVEDFSGGVCSRPLPPKDGTVYALRNMQVDGKALFPLSLPRETDYSFCDGAVTNEAYADGLWIFRKGHTLYGMKEGRFLIIGLEGMMEEDHGAIFHAGNSFYVIDGTRILRVGTGLAYTILTQEPTLWYVGVSADGRRYTENEKPNPFCRYLEYEVTASYAGVYTVPAHLSVDASYARVWRMDGTIVSSSEYTFDGTKVTIEDYDENGYRIRLMLAESSEDESLTTFATLAEDRALFAEAGNIFETSLPSYANVYLYRDGTTERRVIALLTDGFWDFTKLSRDKIMTHNHVELISALVAYADGYLVFSEGAVKKLTFTENTQTLQFHFSVVPFKNDFGSDMAGSICGFDDKIIFANSRSGIYYINKFGISERDVSRRISVNIESDFFSHTDEEYKNATAICAFGKYYLTVGGQTYIWDYSARLPSSTQNIADEYRMLWTISDAWDPALYVREVAKQLYYVDRETEKMCFLVQEGAGDEEIACYVKTAESDFGVKREKRLSALIVRYRAAGEVKLIVDYDGTSAPTEYTLPAAKKFESVLLKPHGKRFHKCAVSLSSASSMALESIIFRYL